VEVIKAGVVWLIGLLNPASAFIKACKAIYDIVMFFVDRGRQIIELVNAILDSLAAIAAGNLAKMAAGVEGALAKMVPVVIGFLASLLGLGNISEKVKEIIEKIQAPVNQAIDWLIGKAVALAKAAGQAVAGMFGKKEKDDKLVSTGDPEHDAKVTAGLADIDTEEQKYLDAHGAISHGAAEKVATEVKKNHPVFKSISVVSREGRWDYDYVASSGQKKGVKKGEDDALSPSGEAPATKENKDAAKEHIKQYTAASQVSQALVALEAKTNKDKLTQYKDEYPAYLDAKGKGEMFQMPLRYLQGRAARSMGRVGEKNWLQEVFPGAAPRTFYLVRGGTDVPRTPDGVDDGHVVDAKDVDYLSFTEQLRDYYTIAKQKDPDTGKPVQVLAADKTKVERNRQFTVIVRKDVPGKQKGTELSGPLLSKLDSVHRVITHEVEEN
jgi:hypothetical protein